MTYPKALDREEIVPLIIAAQAGDLAARNRVVAANMRLVVAMATQLARRARRMDLIEDLTQAGVVGIRDGATQYGLVRAIATFEPAKGLAFSTYARFWIHEAMFFALTDLQHSVMGRATIKRHATIRKVVARLGVALGRTPTVDEIKADYVARKVGAPSAERIERALRPQISSEPLEDDIADTAAPDAVALLGGEQDRQRLLTALAALSVTEQKVIRDRFGFGDTAPRKLADIGTDLALSRERVRQIESGALTKLRRAMDRDAVAQ